MTKSIKFFVAAAVALTAAAGIAADGEQQRFTQDGQTYVYTKTVKGDRTIIDGRRTPSGTGFHLVVRGDTVSGVSGGQPVSFKLTEASGAANSASVLAAN